MKSLEKFFLFPLLAKESESIDFLVRAAPRICRNGFALVS
jgi:hypothetical protein